MLHGWMVGLMDGWGDAWLGDEGMLDGSMNGLKDGGMERWMKDGWIVNKHKQ